MNNLATAQNSRLTATIFGDALCDFISDRQWSIPVYYRNYLKAKERNENILARKLDCLQARMVSRRGMVAGDIKRGTLRFLVLLVPRSDMDRVLSMDPPRPGEITLAKAGDMHWAVRLDRAKGGMLGGFSTMQINSHQRIRVPVPGLSGEYDRRIVA